MAATKKTIQESQGKKTNEQKESVFSSFSNWIKGLGRKKWLLLLLVVVVVGVLLIVNNIRQNQQKALAALETVQVVKGDLVAIVGATGTVNANQSADLIWETNGRVQSVDVKLIEKVSQGQVLAVLDPTSVSQAINSARTELVSAKRNLEDVLQSHTAEAEAYLDVLQAEENFKTARDDRDYWNYKDAAWDVVYQYRTAFIQAESDLQKAQKAVDDTAALSTEDSIRIAAEGDLKQAQITRDKALSSLNSVLGKNYDQTVAEDFANYEVAKAKMEDARRIWERLKDGPSKDDIEAAQARVDAAESAVAMAFIKTPFTGTVTVVNAKAGDEIQAGLSSFRVDDLSKLIIKVEIPEVDINVVKIGQPANLTFDAILGKVYSGIVTEVQPVGTINQGVVNFIVSIELKDGNGQVKPGMTAAVNIVVSEVKDVLIVPNRAVRLQDGNYIVYVMRNGSPTIVPVEIGASSDTGTQISSGDLVEGDLVILNPPFEIPTNAGMPGFVRQ